MSKRETFLIIIVVVATVLLFAACLAFSEFSSKSRTLAEVGSKTCKMDSDCVIIPAFDEDNPCCAVCGEEAVNKQGKVAWEQWYSQSCKNAQCPMYDCYMQMISIPRCVENKCEIEWKDR